MRRKIGKNQQKILLLLLGGIALGLSASPRRYFKILGDICKDWQTINNQSTRRSIKSLYNSQLVREEFNKDGTVALVLSKRGREVALTYAIQPMEINPPKQWDKKWRIVIFDIPEKRKKVRDTFRFHLQHMDFCELQKSVFVHPFECTRQIQSLVDMYGLEKHVRYIRANFVDNEKVLKEYFKLA